jgi:hypothetical protein
MFEEGIRGRKWKDRQCNDQKKKAKMTNNDPQNNTQNIKHRPTKTSLKIANYHIL